MGDGERTTIEVGPVSTAAPQDAPEQPSTLQTLVVAQVLSGAGVAAGITVGALLAREMLGSEDLAGLPSALFTGGTAAASVLIGRASEQWGRRLGLSMGYVAGAVGAALVVLAALLDSVVLLLPSLVLYGAGAATNLLARYAGADLAAPARRARAISTVLVATTLGAVVGPNLSSASGRLADGAGLPRLAGPFVMASVAYGLAATVLFIRLRPDPLLLARQRATTADATAPGAPGGDAPSGPGLPPRAVVLGGAVMMASQLVMVAVMTMMPVYMSDHDHDLGATGIVIALHVAGMFLPSPLTGRLVDRVGSRAVAMASGATLAVSAGLIVAIPPQSTAGLAVALAVVGVGWNLGFVSGTAIVADAVALTGRARVQGLVDLWVAVAGAVAGLGSGVFASATSYPTLAATAAVVAAAMVPVVSRSSLLRRDPTGGLMP